MDIKSDFSFADESHAAQSSTLSERANWRVLLVDDEEMVHSVSRLVLANYRFAGRGLDITSAYSAQEARELLSQGSFALALVDIGMETDHAGLDLLKFIRCDLQDQNIRLVLRTGQTGQAPEESLISEYDISDYKDKTELTATKLRTLIYSTLRSYRDTRALANNRLSLEKMLEALTGIGELSTLKTFTSALLMQLTALFDLNEDAALLRLNGCSSRDEHKTYSIIVGTGCFTRELGETEDGQFKHEPSSEPLPTELVEALDETVAYRYHRYFDDHLVAYSSSTPALTHLLYLSTFHPLSTADKQFIEGACSKLAAAFERSY